MKSYFISYVYEDKKYKNKIIKWAKEGRLGDIRILSEPPDVRPGGEKSIKKVLSPLLQKADATIVLIGEDTHNHDWIRYEIQHTLSEGKKVYIVRIMHTKGTPPEIVSDEEKYPEITFEPDAINRAFLRR